MHEIKMVVGLGNPGRGYVNTRHNVGFRVIDSLAEALNIDVRKKKFGAVFGSCEFADKKLILLKPWQFMNSSGQAVAKAVGFYRLGHSDLLVITDDMALEPGRIRIRTKGSSGGHKGLADIMEKLATHSISRLRIGIGRSDRQDAVDFVLDKPTGTEKPLLDEAIERARDAALCWVEYGIGTTMNRFN
ncbi:MAG TPA: aminoacyl-tRNA hydrolase [Sedimentisphaerales bacterium]|nr:aminoacyl-tRNA hydrolase [Sedimentisphaerales bacterium]